MTIARPGSGASRAGWGIADQSLSSITNFAVGLLAARQLGPSAFGLYSVAFATFTLVLGAARSISSEPFVVRYSHRQQTDVTAATARGAGAALSIGCLGSLACVAVAFVQRDDARAAFLALALVLPGLILQDFWRFTFFANYRGQSAFLNDLVWLIALVPGLAIIMGNESASPSTFLLVWGLAAAVAALVGLFQTRIVPRPDQFTVWLRGHRDLIPRFFGEFVGSNGLSQIALYAIGAVAGLSSLGAIRAAQMLLGPLNVLFQGTRMFAIPEGVRIARSGFVPLLRFARRISLWLAFSAVCWGLALMFIPDTFGEWLLRDSWAPASEVLLILAVSMAGSGVISGAFIGLRALAAASSSLRAQWFAGTFMVVGSGLGAYATGTRGAAIGIALSAWLGSLVWWTSLLGRRYQSDASIGQPTPPDVFS